LRTYPEPLLLCNCDRALEMAEAMVMAVGYFSWHLLRGLVVGSKLLNLISFSLLSFVLFIYLFFFIKRKFLIVFAALVWS